MTSVIKRMEANVARYVEKRETPITVFLQIGLLLCWRFVGWCWKKVKPIAEIMLAILALYLLGWSER